MAIDPKVLDAQNKVEAKRAQLMTSVKYGVGEAKRRLAPDLLAEQAWDKAKSKAADSAHDAVVAAKNNPLLLGGIGAAIGLFLARGKIGEVIQDGIGAIGERFGDGPDDQPAAEAATSSEPPETPVAVAMEAKKRQAGAAKAKMPSKRAPKKKSKTEDVK